MQPQKITHTFDFKIYRGKEIAEIINQLAQLRIEVFKEYPYLYDGTIAYEEDYLSRYLNIKDSFVLMLFDNQNAIGATTAAPLEDEREDFRLPFEKSGLDVSKIFYFGESVLLPKYRGMKLYRNFMQERENAARAHGTKLCAFFSVKRPDNHVLKPKNYQDLTPIWNYYGFIEHPEIEAWYSWKDINKKEATRKPFSAWIKTC